MRFILSALAAAAGAVMLVIGLVQFSAAAAVDSITASGESTSGAPVIVLDESVLSSHAGAQSITITGDGPIRVAIGRTGDVHGWVGDAKHDLISVGDAVDGETQQEELVFTASGSEASVPDPLASDLWIETQEGENELTINTVVAPWYSMLIASDGEQPAPSSVSITWPFGGYAPLSGPLIVAGSVMLAVAAGLLAWGLAARRRRMQRPAIAPAVPSRQPETPVAEPESWSAINWDDELAATVLAAAAQSGADDERASEPDAQPDLEVADEPTVEAASEPEASLFAPPAPVTETEPQPVAEVAAETEAEAEAEPESAPEAEPEPEPEPVAAAEPEQAPEPETNLESASPAEPASTPEQTADAASGQTVEPAAPAAEPQSETASEEDKWKRPRGRNRSTAPKRVFLVAPVLLTGALALSGCAPQYWPASWTGTDISPTATPTSEVDAAIMDEGAHYPVLSTERADKIVAEAAKLAQDADAKKDAKILEARFAGDAYAERAALYQAQQKDAELPGPVPFPTGKVAYLVPDATQDWPRTAFAVVNATSDGSADAVPFGVILTQESARDAYRITTLVQLAPGIELPEAAPVEIGAAPLSELADGLVMEPDAIAAAYADIIAKGDKSSHAKTFSAEHDSLREQVNDTYRKQESDALDAAVAKLEFSYGASDTAPAGVTTLDGGAIIAVSINETEKLSAVSDRSRISVEGRTAALAGVNQSQYGFQRVYTDQLLFYVPSAEAGGQIQFLGSSQAMTSARELKENEVNTNG